MRGCGHCWHEKMEEEEMEEEVASPEQAVVKTYPDVEVVDRMQELTETLEVVIRKLRTRVPYLRC